MDEEIKRMDVREFREAGFLQEANRLFFHPLGLALEVIQCADGTERLGGIWDYRDDPSGISFSEPPSHAKAMLVRELSEKALEVHQKTLGYYIQPCDNTVTM